MLKLTTNQIKIILFLGLVGLIQTPLFLNIQLLVYAPILFPHFSKIYLFDSVLLLIACSYLINRLEFLKRSELLIGFFAMLVPYVALKWMGVYYDHANYMIAEVEGRETGGGAAFGHLWLFFYLLGPAQLVSSLGTLVSQKKI